MLTKEQEIDFEFMRRAAERVDLYVNLHKDHDPEADRGGPIYVQTRRKFFAGKKIEPVSLGRYLTFDAAWKLIERYDEPPKGRA